MKVFWKITAFVLVLSAGLFGQSKPSETVESDQYAAEIVWSRYKVSAVGASFMFPKLPTMTGGVGEDPCLESTGNVYFAYADETLYEFRFSKKMPVRPGVSCREYSPFGTAALNRRVKDIESYNSPVKEFGSLPGNRKIKIVYEWKTADERSVRWVIPDLENDRWIELAITTRPDKKPDEKRFFESLSLTADDGIEIAGGSPTILGDRGVVLKTLSPDAAASSAEVTIKAKPRPGYNDVARQKNTQGTVTLDVTFLANGTIGNVSIVKELANGLTEQAISAARRIVFLPARTNGLPITSVKQLIYSFSIY